jgi:hypothetical protein
MARIRTLVIGVAKAYVAQGTALQRLNEKASEEERNFLDSITPREMSLNINGKGGDVG